MNIRTSFVIVICVFIVSVAGISIFAPPAPEYITIQDIWILDQTQSTRWLEALKSKEIKVDDVSVNVYFDKEHFRNIIREKHIDVDSNRLN